MGAAEGRFASSAEAVNLCLTRPGCVQVFKTKPVGLSAQNSAKKRYTPKICFAGREQSHVRKRSPMNASKQERDILIAQANKGRA